VGRERAGAHRRVKVRVRTPGAGSATEGHAAVVILDAAPRNASEVHHAR